MPTVAELGQRVKAKHPQYADLDDQAVGERIKAKFPQYNDFSEEQAPTSVGAASKPRSGEKVESSTKFPLSFHSTAEEVGRPRQLQAVENPRITLPLQPVPLFPTPAAREATRRIGSAPPRPKPTIGPVPEGDRWKLQYPEPFVKTAEFARGLVGVDELNRGDVTAVLPDPVSRLKPLARAAKGAIQGLKPVLRGVRKAPPKPKIQLPDPDVEKAFQAAGKPEKLSLGQKIGRAAGAVKEKASGFTRTYEHLPRGERYGPLIFKLKQLEKAPSLAADRAIRDLDVITKGMDPADYDAFRKKVVLDDAVESADIFAAQGKAWDEFPFKIQSRKQLGELQQFVTDQTASNPTIQRALATRKQVQDRLRTDLADSMKAAGFSVDNKLTRENYFHHRVLDYMNANRPGKLKGALLGPGRSEVSLQAPTKRGYLRKRSPNALDYSTDYLESEYKVMSQMLTDIQTAKTLAWVRDPKNGLDITKALRAEAKRRRAAGEDVDWKQLVPEGYTVWLPEKGGNFYLADTVSEATAKRVLESTVGDMVTPQQMRKALARANQQEIAIPSEVAATLDSRSTHAAAERALNWGQTKWKQYQLVSPLRFAKYNIRNLSGDAEATFVGNPSGFRRVPEAMKDLRAFYRNGTISPRMQGWFDRGGMQTLLQAQEMGDLKKIRQLRHLEPGKKQSPSYWEWVRKKTDEREGILRYANYLDYLDQVKTTGRPRNFGASIPEEVMALQVPEDKAFKMSNDLLGAYDEISVTGQVLRRDLIPFWSFQEINAKRYLRFARNAAREGELANAMGRKLLGKAAFRAPYLAYRVGAFGVKAAALWSMLHTYNKTRFPEEYKEIPDDVKHRPFLILGRDEETGKVRYFTRLGASSDIAEWFGPEEHAPTVKRWLNGERNLQETAQEFASEQGITVANKFWQSLSPIFKTPTELVAGATTYPDIRRAGLIKDPYEYAFRQFPPFDEIYRRVSGKPVRSSFSEEPAKALGDVARRALYYEIDRGQASYYRVKDRVRDFQEEVLGDKPGRGTGYWDESTEALYNLRLAIRYGDEQAQDKYLGLYLTKPTRDPLRNIQASMERLHPLANLNQQEKVAFLQWMKDEDEEDLTQALGFYSETLLGQPKPQQGATQ